MAKTILALLSGMYFLAACAGKVTVKQPDYYQAIPYVEIIDPRFAKEFLDKYVRFEAVFSGILNTRMDLPFQYQNYLRIQVCSPESFSGSSGTINCDNLFSDLVIAESKSASIENLKPGQKINIRAYAVKGLWNPGTRNNLLLVADFLEAVK